MGWTGPMLADPPLPRQRSIVAPWTPWPSHVRRRWRRRSPARALSAVVIGSVVGSVVVGSALFGSVVAAVGSTGSVSARSTDDAETAVGSQGTWVWPVPGPRVLERPFDRPDHAYGAGHRGIDVGAHAEASVTAPSSGTVLFAGPVAGRSVVTIDHGRGLVSSYDPVVPAVAAGAEVAPGTVIGVVESGEAMHCPDGCLHLGVRLMGEYIDPRPFFGRPVRAVLLPLAG